MTELLSLEFFRNAVVTGIILSLLYGIISFFVVMRKMAFLGAGIAHAAFGGVALGVFLGTSPFWTSLAFSVAVALVIVRMSRTGSVSIDTGIGIFFSFSMAMGAILIALKKDYSFDLAGYLFGNILGIQVQDTLLTLGVALIFLPFVIVFLNRLIFLSFDEEVARISGVNTALLDTLLLIFLAMIIVVSIKVVGIILVSALVVLPASVGLLLSRNYRFVLVAGILYTFIIIQGGLYLSYVLDTPAGATIVTLGTVLYLLFFGISRARS